jgi:hypothetical protein
MMMGARGVRSSAKWGNGQTGRGQFLAGALAGPSASCVVTALLLYAVCGSVDGLVHSHSFPFCSIIWSVVNIWRVRGMGPTVWFVWNSRDFICNGLGLAMEEMSEHAWYVYFGIVGRYEGPYVPWYVPTCTREVVNH